MFSDVFKFISCVFVCFLCVGAWCSNFGSCLPNVDANFSDSDDSDICAVLDWKATDRIIEELRKDELDRKTTVLKTKGKALDDSAVNSGQTARVPEGSRKTN